LGSRRRRKAAAKLPLRLDTGSPLHACAILDTANDRDNKRTRKVCAGLQNGELVLFNKAKVDFDHLQDRGARDVSCVTQAKDSFQYTVVRRLPVPASGGILKN
jgi:hypothetical protein